MIGLSGSELAGLPLSFFLIGHKKQTKIALAIEVRKLQKVPKRKTFLTVTLDISQK